MTVTLTTRRNSAPVIDVELYYYWRKETATRGEDYRPPPGEVFTSNVLFTTVPTSAFSPNAAGTAWEAERTFTISIVDDQEAEADEAIVFYVSTRASNSPNHTITIRDDDTPVMRNVTLVSGPGSDGVWSVGERVELDVRYTLPVVVEQPEECWSYNADGTCKPPGPFVAVVFRSDARPGYGEGLSVALAPYVGELGGSGMRVLRFAYTVGAAEDGALGVVVVDGKVLLRGATISPLGGGDDVEPEFTRTRVMQVNVRKPGGSAWTAGDAVRVNVRFAGPEAAASNQPPNRDKVEVNEAGGTPSIGLRLGDGETRTLARAAQYMGGSGSNTLRFEYEVTAGDGRVNAAEVKANTLALNGATIRNERGYDAELYHLSAVQYAQRPSLSVADAEATEGEDATLDFVVRLDGNSGSDVTVDYRTRDETATAGSDYTETRGGLTFEPGEDEKTVSVPIRDDAVHDDGETFTLLLSNVSGAGVANDDYEAVGTIREPPPTCPENADDVWCGVITVEDAAGTYGYNSFYDQGELSDNDFDVGTNSYTILIISVAGQRDKEDYGNLALQIDPRPNAEEKEELAELTLYLDNDAFKLSESRDGPSGFYYWVADLDWSSEGYILARLGDASSGNSQRREESSPALSVADAEATEGEDETLDFLVRLDGNPGSDVTVDYGTRDGTATAGSDYTETSGTLTFEPGEDEQTVSVPITDDDVEDDRETFTLVLSNASGAGVANDDYEAVGTIRNDETEAPSGGLTASFEDMPETHDGESAFTFWVAFSEDIGISFQALREDAFTVTGGRVTGGGRVDDRRDLFEMTVEPDGDGDVTIELAAGRECATSGAICTKGENRRQLTNSPSVTVAGPAGGSGPPELTASFVGMPTKHDGERAFRFRVAFSENIGISFRALRQDAFTVTGGQVTRGRRVDGRRDLFRMTVRPDSDGDVTITLPEGRACGVSGAICTKGENRRQLTNSPSATVKGPAASSAAAAPGWPDRAARLCSALAEGDGLTPSSAAAALWGDGDPGKDRLDALDSLGNGNGGYDLGDMLAWAARCRGGEASGPAAGSGPPSPPPALPASGPAGGASWRRKGARGPARHRRTVPDPPATGSATRRSGWLRTALLAAVISVWGCGDGIVDPRNDAPRYDVANASVVDPGPLHVRLTAPAGARDIGAMLVIEGPAIDSVQAPGLEIFETDESSSTRREVVIAGALAPDAPVLRVWVPHRGDEARYRIRLLQVAAEDLSLRDLAAYGTAISR